MSSSRNQRCWQLVVAYDGTDYVGWQIQPNGVSIQQVLEEAFAQVTGESPRLLASGRTDAGVHALGQVVRWYGNPKIVPMELRRALNATRPHDIAILGLREVCGSFHPIRDAIRKRYRYVLQIGYQQDPFHRKYAWHVRHELSLPAMKLAATQLTGRYDFSSFETSGSPRESSVRNVERLSIETGSSPCGAGEFTIEIVADGFLYNMVRNIVGTLVEVGKGKYDSNEVARIRDACDRRQAGPTAPPQGLYLVDVEYPADIELTPSS